MVEYKYPPNKIIFPYAFILFMPALGVFAWFSKPNALNEVGAIGVIFWIFLFAMAAPIIVWIVNNISLRINVTDSGFHYKSLFKDKQIVWNDIIDIQKRILYERRGWHDDPKNGNDLLIKLHDGTKVKIFGIIRSSNGSGGSIDDLEGLLRTKANIQHHNPENGKAKESDRQLRLAIVAGALCTVMGILILLRPIPGQATKAWILLICGCLLAIWAFYSLKEKRKL